MNKIIILIVCLVTLGIIVRCTSKNEVIRTSDLNHLKSKYSAEVINYFYETVFYQDFVGPKDFLFKWQDNIFISIEGDLWPGDSVYVIDAVEQLAFLDLPFKVNITEDTAEANIRVCFGEYKSLEKKLGLKEYVLFRGIGLVQDTVATIKRAKVGIANNAKSYKKLTSPDRALVRQSIVLEEITQTWGIIGDSWKNQGSVFFEGDNKVIHLDSYDREILNLLYEPAIPPKYSRTQFEEDFKDVLYHKDAKKKIIDYIKKHKTPVKYLQYLTENSPGDDTLLVKYSGPTFVRLEGDFQQEDLEFCKKAIQELNKVSNQFQLEIAPDDIWHAYPSIVITYHDSLLNPTVFSHRSLMKSEMMFIRRAKGTIKLSYGKSDKRELQEAKNKLLFTSLYKILGMDYIKDEIADIDSANNITFKPDYKEILALLYDPVIPNGFSKKEMEEVIAELKK